VAALIVFLFGLVFGSFLNVCIWRIPRGESVIAPASHCPACGAPIRPWQNIPVLSYLLLRGKCAKCRARISPQYIIVELITALLALTCFLAFGFSPAFVKWFAFCALNVVLIFTDIRERILPNSVNFTGLAVGLVASLFVPVPGGAARWLSGYFPAHPLPAPMLSLFEALVGAACGGGILWLFAEGYFRLRHREGMGMGDVKMLLMAGSFLGWQDAVLTILLASVIGSVVGLISLALRRSGRDYEWPFGAFIGVSAIAIVFWGQPVLTWYLSLF
jgi:leader peptidase (prepilin peptidase) / N-methyltransferase